MRKKSNDLSNPDLLKWHGEGQFIAFEGFRCFYQDKGSGPALLMVHGFPTSSWDWHEVFPELAQHFRAVAPDMMGFGFSDKPKRADYSVPIHAVMHERLLRELGIKDVHILTYSSGSSVVQQMLANNLETKTGKPQLNIRSVTFLNGGLFPGSNHPNRVQKLLLSPLGPLIARLNKRSSLDKGMRAIFGPDTQPDEQLITDYWELLCLNQGNLRIHKLITYLNDRRNLASVWERALIGHPAQKQLIIGMTDSISGPEVAAEYRQIVPDPQIIELDNIGHYPQLEAPDVVIEAIRNIALSKSD